MLGVRGGRWIAALAVLVAVACLSLSGPVEAQSGAGQRQVGPAARAQELKGSGLKAGVAGLSAAEEALAAVRAREEAALIAREREERAALVRQLAEAAAASASHSLAITYAAIALLVVTASLWLMSFLQSRDLKAAVLAVQGSSAAAKSAADFMQRALVLTQRATVIVSEPRAVWLRDACGKLVGCRLLVTWHNVGGTPTRSMIAAVAGLATEKPPSQTAALPRMEARQQPAIVGPNAALNSASVNLPIGLVADIVERKAYYQLAGWAEYNDVFDNTPRHRVEFCYWLEIEGNPQAQHLEARFHIHGKHNRHCDSWDDVGAPVHTVSDPLGLTP